jgi:hypothetical protein
VAELQPGSRVAMGDELRDGRMAQEQSTHMMAAGQHMVRETAHRPGHQARRPQHTACQMGSRQAPRLLDMVEATHGALRLRPTSPSKQKAAGRTSHRRTAGVLMHMMRLRPVRMPPPLLLLQ